MLKKKKKHAYYELELIELTRTQILSSNLHPLNKFLNLIDNAISSQPSADH